MVASASKILTVSYGTFSCTLEGFDEPFIMMKAVAEYFRDLAADDRYFGAEPPQPDGEALQRLAGRDIRQRVEARVDGAGVTLRASAAEPAPVAAAAPAAVAPRSFADPVVVAPDPQVNHEVAAKLERIRRAVAEARASVAQDTAARLGDTPEIPSATICDETADLLLHLPEQV
ncbi:MAG TPA: chemotaxis protein CheA, partial [Paenirhodobacter sp.]